MLDGAREVLGLWLVWTDGERLRVLADLGFHVAFEFW